MKKSDKLTGIYIGITLCIVMVGANFSNNNQKEDDTVTSASIKAGETVAGIDNENKNYIDYSNPEAYNPLAVGSTLNGDFGAFVSDTINGERVSSGIFADYDLTMVNIWATWCPPCVAEMGELQELYISLENSGYNVNMITICDDASSNLKLAKEILDANNATFTTIIADANIKSTIISRYNSFPTTVFVDSNGDIVGAPVVGAPRNVVETYTSEILGRL